MLNAYVTLQVDDILVTLNIEYFAWN